MKSPQRSPVNAPRTTARVSRVDHACAPARRRPPALKDAAGNPLRTGQTVTDDTLGDCIVRGTVPLDKGDRRRSSLASSSTFAGSRRTVDPWVPSRHSQDYLFDAASLQEIQIQGQVHRRLNRTCQPPSRELRFRPSIAPYDSWCLLEKDEAAVDC